MPHPGLLAGLLAATVAGTGTGSRYELSVGADLTRRGDSTGNEALGGDLLLGARFYLRPVVDDATPIALQPYLQRRSTIALDASFGGELVDGDVGARQLRGGGQVTVDAYVRRWLALTAVASVAQRSDRGTTAPPMVDPSSVDADVTSLAIGVGLGLRLGDVRLDAGYRLRPLIQDRAWVGQSPAALHGLVAGVRSVLLEHIDLGLTVETLEGGARAAFHWDYYPSRRLGLLAGIGAGHGRLRALGPAGESALDARIGLDFRYTPRLGATLLYLPTWSSNPDGGRIEQVVSLVFVTRI